MNSNNNDKNHLNKNNKSEDEKSSDYFTALSPLAMFFQLSINMVTPIFICLFIGMWLDKTFKREYLFTLIFVFLGIGSSIRTMYVTVTRFSKNTGKKNDKTNK